MTTKKRLSTNDLRSMIGNLTFGRALKSERESRNMARSDFGKILGITIQSLADLENERRIPSPARAVKIAQALKEPSEYWVQLAMQDQLNKQGIDLKVTIAS
jgi:transcriptional regulator with XRE-family HTH domain